MKKLLRSFYYLILLSVFCGPQLAGAKTFRNDYLEFKISDRWNCQRQAIDWICRPQGVHSPQALIIVTAKQTGPEDNLQNFFSYLSKPKAVAARGQAKITSEVIHTKQRDIFGHTWVEGLQLNSEVENFFTLYLATVKRGLSILVSLSVEKPIATLFNEDFTSVVQSLKIVADEQFLAQLDEIRGANGGPIGIPDKVLSSNPDDIGLISEGPSSARKILLYVLAGLLVIAVFYLGWLVSKKPNKRQKKNKN